MKNHFFVMIFFVVISCEKEKPNNGIDPPLPLITDGDPAWSPNGDMIAYYHAQRADSEQSGIYLIRTDGTERKFIIYAGGNPSWSPNGKWLAIDQLGDGHIYKLSVETGEHFRLTNGIKGNFFPQWCPDSNRIVFSSDDFVPFDQRGIYIVNSDGSNKRLLYSSVTKPTGSDPIWTPDGKKIIFCGQGENEKYPLMSFDTLSKNIESIKSFNAWISFPRMSPNGKKIVFEKGLGPDNNELEIWIMNSDGKYLTRLRKGGMNPSWSPDGKYIVYTKYFFNHPPKGNGYLWIMKSDGSGDRQLTK